MILVYIFFSGIALFLAGDIMSIFYFTSMAIGDTIYGIGYVLFHNIMFHRRIKGIRLKAKTPYLRRIVNARRFHHQNSTKREGRAIRFLYAPATYKVD